jgi:hypothetical protein
MVLRARLGEACMAGFVLAVGAATLAGSFAFPYETEFGPDAGFFPFWIGLVGTAVGGALVVQALTAPRDADAERPVGGRRQLGAAALFLAYVVALGYFGFPASTFAFLFVLLILVERRSAVQSGLYAVAMTAGFTMLFEWAFRLPLPTAHF